MRIAATVMHFNFMFKLINVMCYLLKLIDHSVKFRIENASLFIYVHFSLS